MAGLKTPRISTVAWLVIGFFAALLWGELFTSVMMPQNLDTILDILQPDPIVGYTYQPNASLMERGRGYDVPFVINSIGLRDREIPPRQDDIFRILLIGNSFSVSHGIAIEESFSRAMENALNRHSDEFSGYRQVEVINCSNAGYNSYNYWKGYTRWAPVLHPDLVLVGYVAGREYQCDAEGTRYLVQDGLLNGRFRKDMQARPPRRNPVRSFRKFLAQNSNSYVLFRNFFYYNEKVDRLLKRGSGGDTSIKFLKPYLLPVPAEVENGWARAFSHLGNLKEEASRDGVGIVIAAIPVITDTDPGKFMELQNRTGRNSHQVDQNQPRAALIKFCSEAGIPLLDPREAVAAVQAITPAYLPDNHWNTAGIAAAAEAMVRQWQEAGHAPFPGAQPSKPTE